MKIINVLLIAFTTLAIGCKTTDSEQVIIGSGTLGSDERAIADKEIKGVVVNDAFLGSFSTRTDISKIFIIAEDNIIPYIETTETASGITISEKSGFTLSNKKDMIVDVKSTSLNSIVINGSGKFIADTLSGVEPKITVNGAGTAQVTDIKGNTVDILINGNGFVLLNGDVATANIIVNNTGIAQISATTSVLNIQINGDGIVYYTGTPTLNTTINGSGKVLKIVN